MKSSEVKEKAQSPIETLVGIDDIFNSRAITKLKRDNEAMLRALEAVVRWGLYADKCPDCGDGFEKDDADVPYHFPGCRFATAEAAIAQVKGE